MDQYLLISFLVGRTSIYQLFWCSPGVQGFDTLPDGNLWILEKCRCNGMITVPTWASEYGCMCKKNNKHGGDTVISKLYSKMEFERTGKVRYDQLTSDNELRRQRLGIEPKNHQKPAKISAVSQCLHCKVMIRSGISLVNQTPSENTWKYHHEIGKIRTCPLPFYDCSSIFPAPFHDKRMGTCENHKGNMGSTWMFHHIFTISPP